MKFYYCFFIFSLYNSIVLVYSFYNKFHFQHDLLLKHYTLNKDNSILNKEQLKDNFIRKYFSQYDDNNPNDLCDEEQEFYIAFGDKNGIFDDLLEINKKIKNEYDYYEYSRKKNNKKHDNQEYDNHEYDDEYDNLEDDDKFEDIGGIRVIYPRELGIITGIDKNRNFIFKQPNKTNETIRPIFPKKRQPIKSKNFELVYNNDLYNFSCVGGYDMIKKELLQCSDILVNYTKYEKFNVKTPRGIILEGNPGNGKTLIAKAFSGEIDIGFIAVSGSQFQEMYVGVGPTRIRELFNLAKQNAPAIIFIDELDALGRKRQNDESNTNAERESTLNELLVQLDGFNSNKGVFLIGATNRYDLLDDALIRPGRIDKKITIGNPDRNTRKKVIEIHINGKPHETNVNIDRLVEITNGLSCAEIESLLNEAMLLALRENRFKFNNDDINIIINRILTGQQNEKHILSDNMIKQVCIHEIGHALISILIGYKKIIKVTLNLWSPNSLGFTLFDDTQDSNVIKTKEDILKEIMVLLGGRIAEEIFYGNKITTGANDDLKRSKLLIQQMIDNFGMGSKTYFPTNSDKYKELIDEEYMFLFDKTYKKTKLLLLKYKKIISECAVVLQNENELNHLQITKLIEKNLN